MEGRVIREWMESGEAQVSSRRGAGEARAEAEDAAVDAVDADDVTNEALITDSKRGRDGAKLTGGCGSGRASV